MQTNNNILNKIIGFPIVTDFKNQSFFIPDYQRGYRWTEREVLDLLNDWNESYKDNPDNSYFMQPIVVKRRKDEESWEVVDGQQRLTTVLLILQALGETDQYNIMYQVLDRSKENVTDIKKCQKTDDDINLFHMDQAYKKAKEWIGEDAKDFGSTDNLKGFIKNKIRFLWYRADLVDDSPGEKIFQRLNIGKIELTQSELIKAIFLSEDNFAEVAVNRKEELARQWDEFEAMFQNDEFWYFLTDRKGADSPTRIEFLLGTMPHICPELFESKDDIDSKDGLFRAYYSVYRKDKSRLLQIWGKAVDFMDITRQWYEDVDLYHLIGFKIIDDRGSGQSLLKIFREWNNNRTVSEFMTEYLIKEIVDKHSAAFENNASKVYGHAKKDGGWEDKKREAFGPLLLSNILHVLRQNKTHENNPDYAQGIFYKFPFHLFKKQIKDKGNGWDVEHVASATDNELEDVKAQREWIFSAYLSLTDKDRKEFNEKQKENISKFFKNDKSNTETSDMDVFKKLYEYLSVHLHIEQDAFRDEQKNKISNYVLLDYSTNRTYKNAIFPTKRQHIKDKERGILEYAKWDDTNGIIICEEAAKSAFVPPCTKDVFMKTYSKVVSNSMAWTLNDAVEYAVYLSDLFNWFKKKYYSSIKTK